MNEFRNKDALPAAAQRSASFREALMRRAAEAGPGYRGRRTPLPFEATRALAAEFEKIGEAAPAFLKTPTTWVDRRAKLFEAGDYPDKGIAIRREDLQRLSDGFDLPAPILIEHADSPLALGFLTQVEASGDELFGTLALTEEANALVEKSGAKSLSLGLDRDLAQIREVSLVRNPRVESARMFHADLRFWTDLDGETTWESRYRELRAKSERAEASQRVESLIAEGRLVPAQAEFAEALLRSGGTIEFDGESRPVSTLVSEFLARQPKLSFYGELAPAPASGSEGLFLPEEAAFYRKHFPDVSLDLIAARKAGK